IPHPESIQLEGFQPLCVFENVPRRDASEDPPQAVQRVSAFLLLSEIFLAQITALLPNLRLSIRRQQQFSHKVAKTTSVAFFIVRLRQQSPHGQVKPPVAGCRPRDPDNRNAPLKGLTHDLPGAADTLCLFAVPESD